MANVATSSHAQSSTQTRDVERTQIQQDTTRNLTEQNNETLNEKIKEATEKLNRQMEDLDTSIRFGYNDKIEAMFVNVLEMKTLRRFAVGRARGHRQLCRSKSVV